MRHLHTIVCAATLAWAGPNPAVMAQDNDQPAQEADRFTNQDLLDQTERDRRLWLNALVVGATSVASMHDAEAARCVARWYFDDDGDLYGQILRAMNDYPDRRPAEIVFALARRECPDFVPSAN